MNSLLYFFRVLLVLLIFIAVIIGNYLNVLEDLISMWRDILFEYRLILTVLVGWPIIGYITPVLIDFWSWVASQVTGLGGDYLISDTNTILILMVFASIAIQTTVFAVKLNQIEERV